MTSNLGYYFRTYDDQTVKVVDLKQLDAKSGKILQYPLKGKQVAVDVTESVK